MYSRGLVLGKASAIGKKDLSQFSQGVKSAKFGVIFNTTQCFKMQRDYLSAERNLCRNDRPVSSPEFKRMTDTRSAVEIQGQEVTGQGYSVTQRIGIKKL